MKFDLKFITYERLYEICEDIIKKLEVSQQDKEKTLHKNVIDPFSALFDAFFNEISLAEWIRIEKSRQIQKTLQNCIGDFHQKVLGSVIGWDDLKKGGVVDLVSSKNKIIAEIKNKFNTTKGNHKMVIYDDLEFLINSRYKGYKAYYVSILTKKRVCKEFTPSDNKTKVRRVANPSIMEVDGSTFYKMVTGDGNALFRLYNSLPNILSDIMKKDDIKINSDPLFEELFKKSFNHK